MRPPHALKARKISPCAEDSSLYERTIAVFRSFRVSTLISRRRRFGGCTSPLVSAAWSGTFTNSGDSGEDFEQKLVFQFSRYRREVYERNPLNNFSSNRCIDCDESQNLLWRAHFHRRRLTVLFERLIYNILRRHFVRAIWTAGAISVIQSLLDSMFIEERVDCCGRWKIYYGIKLTFFYFFTCKICASLCRARHHICKSYS